MVAPWLFVLAVSNSTLNSTEVYDSDGSSTESAGLIISLVFICALIGVPLLSFAFQAVMQAYTNKPLVKYAAVEAVASTHPKTGVVKK